MEPMIEVQNLCKSFNDVKAVQDVSFDVKAGECFALLGPNGAGKSTTIKMLITLLAADSGEAKINGFSLKTAPSRIRESIGYVPQSLSVDGALTGRENLTIFGKLYGLNHAELKERVPQILEMMDLTDSANRPVAHYSGGMVRRLEIAQSMLHKPAILFLDEPTIGLDPVAREAVWKHVKQLRALYKTTIFLTTHYMEEAEALCTRIAIMRRGKIVALGSHEELIAAHAKIDATLDDIFTHYTEDETEADGGYREVIKARKKGSRLQ
jgi:ABC-2 type transport system ATP-binding protein